MNHRIVVMGVSGCGKSTLAARLAEVMDGRFIEGDDHHAPHSIDKMRRGVALNDGDREPWLDQLATLMNAHAGTAILSCSALKLNYRMRLRAAVPDLKFVFLDISLRDSLERVKVRQEHWFPAQLVVAQFAALEAPSGEAGVLCVPARQSVELGVEAVARWIGASACRAGT